MEKKNGRTSLENEDEMASDVKKSQIDVKIDAKDSVVFSAVVIITVTYNVTNYCNV